MSGEGSGASSGQRHRLLVGVDFGTTYTGVAYCLSSNNSLSEIETITTWPGSGGSIEKVPTELAYISSHGLKWGSEASGSHYSRGINGHPEIYGRFKLLLDPSICRDVYNGPDCGRGIAAHIPLPASKTAMQLCTDYLRQLYGHIMNNILKKRMPDTLASTPIEFIFTVPAIWSHKAQEATRAAASRAGFGSNGRPMDTMSMISEPEAAAIYALSALHEDRKKLEEAGLKTANLEPGDHFIVCDAGGGTVDLITYQIQQVFPDLKLRESVVGGGGKCGSTYIDEGFHRLLSDKIGPSFDDATIWTSKKKGKGSQLMQKFEACKRTFGQAENDVWFLELPVNVEDDEEQGITDNELELSSDDMKALFDPVVDEIIKLVAHQANKVKPEDGGYEDEGQLTTIILVGGFGESQYLYKRLQQWGLEHNPPLTVINPPKSWSAIVRGAVLQALRPAIGSRKLRCHYGFKCATEYDPSYHKKNKARLSIWHKGWRIDDNVQWAAHLGDDCSEEKEIEFVIFFDLTSKSNLKSGFSLRLLGCRYHEAPRESSSKKVFRIGRIPLDFSDINLKDLPKRTVDGKTHYQNNCTVKMRMGSADASFSVWIGERCYGNSRIAYND
ncbi:Heat shock protein [Drechslerella dactyloides]|uniref:Heat shock protein n=1 Tax=Drechslerella dactyloides TaxID=74499 RepID=A0AAD6NKQ3_DREDA|nr:Heat shock protein [Drechslerella dactyloides]